MFLAFLVLSKALQVCLVHSKPSISIIFKVLTKFVHGVLICIKVFIELFYVKNLSLMLDNFSWNFKTCFGNIEKQQIFSNMDATFNKSYINQFSFGVFGFYSKFSDWSLYGFFFFFYTHTRLRVKGANI